MNDSTDDTVLDAVTSFYLESDHFNGIPLETLAERTSWARERLTPVLSRLVEARRVDVVFEADGNPHIKRLAPIDPEKQIARLAGAEGAVCIYPTAETLSEIELPGLDEVPYTRSLALGEPHLTPAFFELSVLERYLSDPRYVVGFDDVVGVIEDTAGPPERASDEIALFLPSFGVGYRAGGFRVLLVYMTHLANMSPGDQQYWKGFEVQEQCVANSDYLDTTSFGKSRQYTSIYAALLGELTALNALCQRIGKPPLFLRTYPDRRPTAFHGMLRPTRQALFDFLVLFDGILSDNVNREFFRGETDMDEEGAPAIDVLDHWLAARFTVPDQPDVVAAELAPIRAVRDMRHGAAEALGDDEYDPEYAKKQDRLVANVYGAVRWLRRVLQGHPDAGGTAAPAWLDGDNIVVY